MRPAADQFVDKFFSHGIVLSDHPLGKIRNGGWRGVPSPTPSAGPPWATLGLTDTLPLPMADCAGAGHTLPLPTPPDTGEAHTCLPPWACASPAAGNTTCSRPLPLCPRTPTGFQDFGRTHGQNGPSLHKSSTFAHPSLSKDLETGIYPSRSPLCRSWPPATCRPPRGLWDCAHHLHFGQPWRPESSPGCALPFWPFPLPPLPESS